MTLKTLGDNILKLHPNLDKNDVELALMHSYGIDTYTEFRLRQHDEIVEKLEFYQIIHRLNNDEPLQYIVSEAYFYDRNFFVNKNVLIPRPETEELVAFVLKEVKEGANLIDAGTGSGVIAVTIASHVKVNVYATDISKKALKVARINDTNNNVTFFHSDLLKKVIKNKINVDVIVANLPYIKRSEKLERKVKAFEPKLALFLKRRNIFKRLFKQVKKLHIGKDGLTIYLEVGTNQDAEVITLARSYFGNSVKIEVRKDMQNRNRFVIIRGIYGN